MKKFIFILITVFLLAASSAQGARHHHKIHKHHTTHHHITKQATKSEATQAAISATEPKEIALTEGSEGYYEEEENKIYSPKEEEEMKEMLANSIESEVIVEEEN